MPLIARSMGSRSMRQKLPSRTSSADSYRIPIILKRRIGSYFSEQASTLVYWWCATALETVTQSELSQRERRISESEKLTKGIGMRDHYDFSESVKNPYAKKLKRQVTIRLDEDTIAYFKNLAEQKDLPYQSLINLYLRDCAQSHKDLKLEWQ